MRHKGLAEGRWSGMSLVEQMAHVGSEVERAIRAHERGNTDRFQGALERALELFDLTVADGRWRGRRRRELARAREEFRALFYGDEGARPSAERVGAYYLQFAVAARRRMTTVGGGLA